jgi:hypothetical protein
VSVGQAMHRLQEGKNANLGGVGLVGSAGRFSGPVQGLRTAPDAFALSPQMSLYLAKARKSGRKNDTVFEA